jgi:GTP1/Obg family GTP-binding protein
LDPTETCGYALEKQLALLDEVKKEFKAPLIVVLNKTDLTAPEITLPAKLLVEKQEFLKAGKDLPIDELKKEIVARLKKK